MKPKVQGLITRKKAHLSFMARMPSFLSSLTLIKGPSKIIARAVSNKLRAGAPVFEMAALEICDVIWVILEEDQLRPALVELAAQPFIRGKIVILCGSVHESGWVAELIEAGALVASLNAVDPQGRLLAGEGDRRAYLELRRLAASEHRKLIRIKPGLKGLYLAGIHSASHLMLVPAAAAVESFRAAGLTRFDAVRAMETLGQRSLRAYGRAAKKAWGVNTTAELRGALERHLETIRAADPRVAAIYLSAVELGIDFFEK